MPQWFEFYRQFSPSQIDVVAAREIGEMSAQAVLGMVILMLIAAIAALTAALIWGARHFMADFKNASQTSALWLETSRQHLSILREIPDRINREIGAAHLDGRERLLRLETDLKDLRNFIEQEHRRIEIQLEQTRSRGSGGSR